jgi:hypothetical protein
MQKIDEYLQMAKALRVRASGAQTSEERLGFVELAREWDLLAKERLAVLEMRRNLSNLNRSLSDDANRAQTDDEPKQSVPSATDTNDSR